SLHLSARQPRSRARSSAHRRPARSSSHDKGSCRLGRGRARERVLTRDRAIDRQRGKIAVTDQRRLQKLVVLAARYLDGAERLEMIGHELGVEQLEAAAAQPRHQMHERHLGGVARAMEHAFAKERAAEAHPVEPTNEALILIDLDAVAMAALVELAIERA